MSQAVKFQAKGYEGNGEETARAQKNLIWPALEKAQKVLPNHIAMGGIAENPFSDQPESRSEMWLPQLTGSEPQ